VSQVLDQIEHAIASKQTATAMQMLDQVLEAPGVDPNSMMRIANIYLQSGNFPKSEEAIKKLAQMVPNSSEPWYNLAVIQSHEGKTADAIASLKKVWELNPEEIKQNKQMIDLRAHFYQDPNFAQLRATPEFKAAFPAKP
jgi:Flp pilus assembly protein TadD